MLNNFVCPWGILIFFSWVFAKYVEEICDQIAQICKSQQRLNLEGRRSVKKCFQLISLLLSRFRRISAATEENCDFVLFLLTVWLFAWNYLIVGCVMKPTRVSYCVKMNTHIVGRSMSCKQTLSLFSFCIAIPVIRERLGKSSFDSDTLTIMVSLPRGSPVDPMSVKGLLTPPEEIRLFSSFPLLQMKAVKQMWYQKSVFVVWSV